MKKEIRITCLIAVASILVQSAAFADTASNTTPAGDWLENIASASNSEPSLLSANSTESSEPTKNSEASSTSDAANGDSLIAAVSGVTENPQAGAAAERAPTESTVAVDPGSPGSDAPSLAMEDGKFSIPKLSDGLLAERIGFDESPSGNFDQIDSLSKKVILKEIELLKLNTRYRIESTRIGKWKPWRQFAYSLAANTLVEVGISHIAYARWKYWRRPALASKAFLRKGPQCLLIGHSILVGGVLIETAFDALAQHQQNKKGFNRKICRNRVVALKGEIDELLKARESALATVSLAPAQTEVLKVEGRVLSGVKDCAVSEFSRLAVRERKIKTARDVANIMTFTQASTGGFIGSLGNLLAVANRKPRLANPAGIGFAISGVFIVLTPPAAKILSIVAAKREKKNETSILGINPQCSAALDADRTALSQALSNAGGSFAPVKGRLEVYSKQKEIMDNQLLAAKAEARQNNKEFIERCVSNTIAGGTKISWGVNLIVAGSDFSNTAPKALPTLPVKLGKKIYRVPIRGTKTPAQMFGRRVAQGATSNIAGPAVGGIDAIQSRFRGEMRGRKAKKNGTAPGQLLAARMKALEEMESKLK